MRIKKLLPVLCMAFGLTMAAPMAVGATGDNTGTQTTTPQLKEGWNYNANGSRYYVEKGKKVTGFHWIANSEGVKLLYYFQPDGINLKPAAGRVKIAGKNYYNYGPNGNFAFVTRQGWLNNKTFYCQGPEKNGELLTNTTAKIGKLYYGFNQYGQRWVKEGRRRLNGKVYYVLKGGFLRTNKWQEMKIYGVTRSYYFNARGEMTGLAKSVVNSKTLLYHVDPKTYKTQKTAGWYKDSQGRTYYVTSIRGRMATGFKNIDGKRYYFSPSNGVLYTNRWIIVNKKAYRADKNGAIVTGWYQMGSKRYYARNDGARVTGLQKINGYTYYFKANGVLQTGWKVIDGKRYYFSPSGSGTSLGMARTGWFNVSGKTYYANSDGTLVTGWLTYNGNRYYLDPNAKGAAVKGKSATIDGLYYTFDSEGRLTNWSPSGSYSIRVDRQRNMVVIYKGGYPVKTFLCSTGLNNATPTGTFSILDKLYMHELNGPTWGFFCSHLTDSILFHSLPGSGPSRDAFPAHKYNLLGQQASEGCIRLRMGDAYWIYSNCPVGTPVTIGDWIIPSSISKPVYQTIPEYLTIDPTDPYDSTNRIYA